MSQFEFMRIHFPESGFGRILPTLIVGTMIYGLVYFNQDELINTGYFTLPLMMTPILLPIIGIFSKKGDVARFTGIGFLSIVVSVIPFAMLNQMANLPYPGNDKGLIPYTMVPVMMVFIFLWVSDSFAYLGGRLMGRTRLAPAISPKKTWEGLITGLVFSNVAAYVAIPFCLPYLSAENLFVMANLTVIFGLLGDLFISRLKRDLGIKDTGNILPGHGGFLDRFDSLLLAAPVVFFYLRTYLQYR